MESAPKYQGTYLRNLYRKAKSAGETLSMKAWLKSNSALKEYRKSWLARKAG